MIKFLFLFLTFTLCNEKIIRASLITYQDPQQYSSQAQQTPNSKTHQQVYQQPQKMPYDLVAIAKQKIAAPTQQTLQDAGFYGSNIVADAISSLTKFWSAKPTTQATQQQAAVKKTISQETNLDDLQLTFPEIAIDGSQSLDVFSFIDKEKSLELIPKFSENKKSPTDITEYTLEETEYDWNKETSWPSADKQQAIEAYKIPQERSWKDVPVIQIKNDVPELIDSPVSQEKPTQLAIQKKMDTMQISTGAKKLKTDDYDDLADDARPLSTKKLLQNLHIQTIPNSSEVEIIVDKTTQEEFQSRYGKEVGSQLCAIYGSEKITINPENIEAFSKGSQTFFDRLYENWQQIKNSAQQNSIIRAITNSWKSVKKYFRRKLKIQKISKKTVEVIDEATGKILIDTSGNNITEEITVFTEIPVDQEEIILHEQKTKTVTSVSAISQAEKTIPDETTSAIPETESADKELLSIHETKSQSSSLMPAIPQTSPIIKFNDFEKSNDMTKTAYTKIQGNLQKAFDAHDKTPMSKLVAEIKIELSHIDMNSPIGQYFDCLFSFFSKHEKNLTKSGVLKIVATENSDYLKEVNRSLKIILNRSAEGSAFPQQFKMDAQALKIAQGKLSWW